MLDFETVAPPPEKLLKPRKPRHEVFATSSTPAKAERKLDAHTFGNFFTSVVAQNNGVIAAFPRSTIDEEAIVNRVIGLDAKRNVGSALWWTQRLTCAKYDASYKHVDHYVYSADGLDRNEWFPRHTDIDTNASETGFDYLTLGGFSTTIRALSPREARESAVIAHRFSHEMECAASGVSPAVVAGFLVCERDAIGQAFVTQRHLFRLSDLLKEYNRFKNNDLLRPSMASIDNCVYELTSAISRKVRSMANARLLKMNMTPGSIVFCPHIVEDDNGEMISAGYGFGRLETKGLPYLADFNPAHTKRGPSSTFNADAAYTVMMVQLLSCVNAQFGDVHRIMLNRLTGRTPTGAALPESELPDSFEQIDLRRSASKCKADTQSTIDMLTAMPCYHKSAELSTAYVSASADVDNAIAAILGRYEPPLFQKLAAHHLQSTLPGTFLKPSDTNASDASNTSDIADRLASVRWQREQMRNAPTVS